MISVRFEDNKEVKINLDKFGDGTLKCSLSNAENEYSIAAYASRRFYATIKWCYDDDSELFALICITNELKEINPEFKICLELPYIPHARQDRHVSGRLFTLKSFAQVINSLNFYHVYVTDPHSDVATALIDRCVVDYGFNFKWKQDKVWMFPDHGAAKKYASLPDAPKDYIIGNKKRNFEGRIESYELINFKEGTEEVWIRDDICSYGGTFVAAAKALKEKGVKTVYLVLSHCENNIHKGDVFKYIDKVYTTDSLYFEEHPQIELYKSFRKIKEN